MSLLEAIVLGIVQGLTEFLPISSTAHLRVVPALCGWGDPGAAFTAVIQLGTLVAVLLYFRHDIVRLVRAVLGDLRALRFGTTPDARLAWMIVVGTVPIVVGGLLFEKAIDTTLRSLYVIAAAAAGFALLLVFAEGWTQRRQQTGLPPKEDTDIGWGEAIFIGVFQALALIPGASRSGVTITAGLFAGLSRPASARFSFLLSLPSVFAAGVYKFYGDFYKKGVATGNPPDYTAVLVASVVAGVLGYASIAFLLGYLKRHSTYLFIVYRLVAGGILLALLGSGALKDE